MSSGLELITPLYVYKNYQSSKNFLDLLEYLATTSKKITEEDIEVINSTVGLPIVIDHKTYTSFDERFWEVLGRFDLSVDWWKYLPKRDDEEPTREISVEEQAAIELIAKNIADADELKGVGQEGASLSYFNEVNELLKSSKEFEKLKGYSDELSLYLNEISIGAAKYDGIKPRPLVPELLWDWLFGTVCQIVSEFLIQNKSEFEKSKKGHKVPKYKAIELCAFFNLLYFGLISIHKVSCVKAFMFPFRNTVEKIQFTVSSLTKGALTFKENESNSDKPLSKSSIEIWTLLVAANLLMSRSDKIVSTEAIDIFISAYTEQSWEIAYDKCEELLFQPIESLLTSSLNSESDGEQDKRISNLYGNDIDLAGIYKFTARNFRSGGKLSLRSTKKLLFETSLNYWDESESHIIYSLAEKLVKECNEEFEKEGAPPNLKLITRSNDYEHLRPYYAYYESISTLGIVLGQPEMGDNFYGNETKSFVKAAIAVHEAGLTDHAVVLLGYGLARICSGMTYKSDFSIREVNQFISRPEIMPRVEKLFLPFLELCLKSQGNLSSATRIWIKSIQSRFTKAQLHVLEFDGSRMEKLAVEKSFTLPLWFSPEDESLVRALKDMKNLSDRMNEMNPEIWQRFMSAKDLRAKLFEISQSLESTTKKLFNPIYQLFISNEKFAGAIQDLRGSRSPLRMESGGVSLGWVEFFIRTIQENSKKNTQVFKKILEIANQEDRAIGKIIYKIQETDEALLNSFQHFRNLDNMLSHKSTKSNRQLSQSETNWMYTYAISDYKLVADLFI